MGLEARRAVVSAPEGVLLEARSLNLPEAGAAP